MKPQILKLTILLSFIFLVNNQAQALCIGCGCQKAYKTCMSRETDDPGCKTLPCGKEECQESRSACHGPGIKIMIGSFNWVVYSPLQANRGKGPDTYGTLLLDWQVFLKSQLYPVLEKKLQSALPIVEKAEKGIKLTESDLDIIASIGAIEISREEVEMLVCTESEGKFPWLQVALGFAIGLIICFLLTVFRRKKQLEN